MTAFQSLDTPSIAFVIFLIAMMLAFGMTAFMKWGRSEQGFGLWVLAQWSLSLGMLALFAREVVPLWISVAVGNALLFLTLALVRLGIARFRERALPVWPDFAVAALITFAITLNALTDGHIEDRIALVAATLAFLSMRCATALQGLTGQLRTVGLFGQCVMLTVAVTMVVRGFIAAVGDPTSASVFEAGLASASVFLSVALATVALPFFLLILNYTRLLEQLHHARAAAESASETDSLTGLMNRRGLFRSIRDFDRTRLIGVCLIDLDHFKAVNDSFGHDVGDRVLMKLARLLQDEVPDGVHARLGGEEFLLVLPDADHLETLDTAERVRVAVAHRLGPESGLHTLITTSIGTCSGPRLRFDELLTSADLALYRAKNAGRDRALGSAPGDAARTPSGRQVRYRTVRQPERSRS